MDDSDSQEPGKPAPRRGAVPMLPRPRGSGFAAEGPGFYVWDETPWEARRNAAELWLVSRPRRD
jgi:hypothetical protein